MYTVFAVLLAAGLILLTAFGGRSGRRGLYLNGILGCTGLLGGIALPCVTRVIVLGGGNTEEWMNWAWDAFLLYLKTTLPFLGICLGVICLTLLTTVAAKKQSAYSAVIRRAASVAVSVILLLVTPFYSAMAETDGGAIHVMILLYGISEALFMRWTLVLDIWSEMCRKSENLP